MLRIFAQFFPSLRNGGPAATADAGRSLPDPGPWRVDEWHNSNQLVLQSEWGPAVALSILGNFENEVQRRAYADQLCGWLNAQTVGRSAEPRGGFVPIQGANLPASIGAARVEPSMDTAQSSAALPAAPAKTVDPKPFGLYGCHCCLEEGEAPDDCVHTTGRREDCSLAMEGIQRDDCAYWQPIVIHRSEDPGRRN